MWFGTRFEELSAGGELGWRWFPCLPWLGTNSGEIKGAPRCHCLFTLEFICKLSDCNSQNSSPQESSALVTTWATKHGGARTRLVMSPTLITKPLLITSRALWLKQKWGAGPHLSGPSVPWRAQRRHLYLLGFLGSNPQTLTWCSLRAAGRPEEQALEGPEPGELLTSGFQEWSWLFRGCHWDQTSCSSALIALLWSRVPPSI